MPSSLRELPAPSLLIDSERLQRNASRMCERARTLGVRLRPHIKTHKCAEIARIQTEGGARAITVSTLAEAEFFAERGFSDITYAVPIEPGKFDRAIELSRKCERLALLTDDAATARALNESAARAAVVLELFLKVDCGYHRCGVDPRSEEARLIPQIIANEDHLRFAGILTHAGHSYHARSRGELLSIARAERDVMKEFAGELRASGIDVPVISIGSTPTMTAVDHLDGISEIRPGNYIFFDAFQAALGSCAAEDCALTVLAAVVHRDISRGKLIVDAGAIALSKDRGAIELDPACGYGRVLDLEGNDLGLRVDSVSQEHGVLSARDGISLEHLPVGSRVRILVNHSCLTAAQHPWYYVLEGDHIIDRWEIQRGW